MRFLEGRAGRRAAIAGAAVLALVVPATTVAIVRRGEGGRSAEQAAAPGADGGAASLGGSGAGSSEPAVGASPGVAASPQAGVTSSAVAAPSTPGAVGGGGRQVVGGVVDPADPGAPDVRPIGPQGPTRSTPCSGSTDPQIAAPVEDRYGADGRRWTAIGSVRGRCGATSSEFQIDAGTLQRDVRLRFRSDAEGLVVDLVDQVEGKDAAAGYHELACDSACAGTQELIPRAGRYRLEVAASDGPWEVAVEVYR